MNQAIHCAPLDMRTIAPHERQSVIFAAFKQLGSGDAIELINDHDPAPLHEQFRARMAGRFGWEYLEQGPATWRVAITKMTPAHGNGTCCGSCGGA